MSMQDYFQLQIMACIHVDRSAGQPSHQPHLAGLCSCTNDFRESKPVLDPMGRLNTCTNGACYECHIGKIPTLRPEHNVCVMGHPCLKNCRKTENLAGLCNILVCTDTQIHDRTCTRTHRNRHAHTHACMLACAHADMHAHAHAHAHT
jgi:hypothetical protein